MKSVDFPDIPSVYEYVDRLRCDCGGKLIPDHREQVCDTSTSLTTRWDLVCSTCKKSVQLMVSLPALPSVEPDDVAKYIRKNFRMPNIDAIRKAVTLWTLGEDGAVTQAESEQEYHQNQVDLLERNQEFVDVVALDSMVVTCFLGIETPSSKVLFQTVVLRSSKSSLYRLTDSLEGARAAHSEAVAVFQSSSLN